MNAQLLLLLALVGPFCAITRASPTELPAELTPLISDIVTHANEVTGATETAKEDVTVITGPPMTEPDVAPAEVTTESVTEEPTPVFAVVTEVFVFDTEAPTTAATEAAELLTTDSPTVTTAAPSEQTDTEVPPAVTAAPETATKDAVVLEDVPEGDSTTGQIVGIVIGALLAVVIVIAVVIAVVRRMGKYSSARNKIPMKKESVVISPLKRKSAKQQENPKFWKF